jgi:hypothetical protein
MVTETQRAVLVRYAGKMAGVAAAAVCLFALSAGVSFVWVTVALASLGGIGIFLGMRVPVSGVGTIAAASDSGVALDDPTVTTPETLTLLNRVGIGVFLFGLGVHAMVWYVGLLLVSVLLDVPL